MGRSIRRVSTETRGHNCGTQDYEDKPVRTRVDSVEEELIVANAENSYRVGPDDLPLHCPLPGYQYELGSCLQIALSQREGQ